LIVAVRIDNILEDYIGNIYHCLDIMKKHLFSILFLAICHISYGQSNNKLDLASGQHFKHSLPKDITGKWHCAECRDDMQISISQGVKEIHVDKVNVSMDCFYVTVNKLVLNGQDISSRFTSPMELTAIPDAPMVRGYYKDPVTNANINVEIDSVADHTFSMNVGFPEMPIDGSSRTTVLPRKATFTR
jgi:hypothetical protein